MAMRKLDLNKFPGIQEVMLNIRLSMNLSQEGIAEKLHVSQRIWSYWERGQRVPKIDNVIKIIALVKNKISKKDMNFLLEYEAYLRSRKQKINIFFDHILYQEMQEIKKNQEKILKKLKALR